MEKKTLPTGTQSAGDEEMMKSLLQKIEVCEASVADLSKTLNFDVCNNVYDVHPHPVGTLADLLKLCESVSMEQIREIRAAKSEEEQRNLKKKLPAANWQSRFEGLNRKNLNSTSTGGYMLDVDHLKLDPREVFRTQVLPRVEDCRIAAVHISPRGEGLRIVAHREEGLSIPECQKRLAETLGLPYDSVCRETARLAFLVPVEEWLYLSAERIANFPIITDSADSDPQTSEVKSAASKGTGAKASVPAAGTSVKEETPLRRLANKWLELHGGRPFEGKRNDTLYRMACVLRYGLKEGEGAEALADAMPEIGLSRAELIGIARSALGADPSEQNMRQLLMLKDAVAADCGEETQADMRLAMLEEELPWLPPVYRELVMIYPPKLRPAVLCSMFPIIGALATAYRAEYNGDVHSTSFMTVVEGTQAGGKSFIRRLMNVLWAEQKRYDAEQEALAREYREAGRRKKGVKELQKDPHAAPRIFGETSSNTALCQQMEYAAGRHLLTVTEEIAIMAQSNTKSWNNMRGFMRLAFDNSIHTQTYTSQDTWSGSVPIYYNLLLGGTKQSVGEFLSDKDFENGTCGRIIFVRMPDTTFDSRSEVEVKRLKPKEEALIQQTTLRLVEMGRMHNQGEPLTTHFINLKWLEKRIGQWVDDKGREAKMVEDHLAGIMRKRSAVMGFRAGMIAMALLGKDNVRGKLRAQVEEFALWTAEYVFNSFLVRFRGKEPSLTASPKPTMPILCEHILDDIGSTFTTKQVEEKACEQGIITPPRQIIYSWRRNNLVRKIKNKLFEKVMA